MSSKLKSINLSKFNDDELDVLLMDVLKEQHQRRLDLSIKNAPEKKSLNGVKISDLIVISNLDYPDNGDNGWRYYLELKKRWNKRREKFVTDEYEEYSDWAELLPDSFSEHSENCYGFSGSNEDAKKLLEKFGFEVIEWSFCEDCLIKDIKPRWTIFYTQDDLMKVSLLSEKYNFEDEEQYGEKFEEWKKEFLKILGEKEFPFDIKEDFFERKIVTEVKDRFKFGYFP